MIHLPLSWNGLSDNWCLFSNSTWKYNLPPPFQWGLGFFSPISVLPLAVFWTVYLPTEGYLTKIPLNFTKAFSLLGSSPTRDLTITSQMNFSKPKLLLKSCSTFFFPTQILQNDVQCIYTRVIPKLAITHKVKATQLCPTLWDSIYCSPPGSSVHGILQAKTLEWVAIPFSRGSFQPKDQTRVSCTADRFFTTTMKSYGMKRRLHKVFVITGGKATWKISGAPTLLNNPCILFGMSIFLAICWILIAYH